MRRSDQELAGIRAEAENAEEALRRENEMLRLRLRELELASAERREAITPSHVWHPSKTTMVAVLLALLLVAAIAFVGGYLPMERRGALLAEQSREEQKALPRVEVVKVVRSPGKAALQLPGNIQAVSEAPVLARADGYVKQRMVDIGDKVHAGQALAVIETPELDEQVRQAQASVDQARASVGQAEANLRQGRSDLEFAAATAKRWAHLVQDGSVSVQENEQYQAQYRSKVSEVESLQQAVTVQKNSVAAAEANLARLQRMKGYQVVTAPFDGVITLRNVDAGALVNNGATLLFRIAQTATLRTYLNVPQTYATSVHKSDPAKLTVSNLSGQVFEGTVARTADALDPSSRTLLVEVRVPNEAGALLPGMYATVELTSSQADPPLLIPSDALVVRSNGPEVAVVGAGNRVHIAKVEPGRDFGDRLEVRSGLQEGDAIIANPGDVETEGTEVEPVGARGR